MRGYYDLYSSYQVIIPLKEYTVENQNIFYKEVTLSSIKSLYIDFFDMNQNFIGAYDLFTNNLSKLNSQNNVKSSSYFLLLSQFLEKVKMTKYSNSTEGMNQFESDVMRI